MRARVTTADGDTRTLDLCELDYRRLARQQRQSSPLESLFGGHGSLFDEFFGDEFLGTSPFGERRGLNERTAPRALDRARRSGEAEERISDHAKELLQGAARHAIEHRRTEVDTEHLLLALTESDVVRTILGQFKVSIDDLRRELEAAPRGDAKPEESGEIGVTPRMKSALGHAFTASHELGHSYVGPEHLLIGLAEEEEGIAGDLLRRYGLTPQAIRQQVVRVVGRGAEEGQVETPTNTPNLDKYARDLTKLAVKASSIR